MGRHPKNYDRLNYGELITKRIQSSNYSHKELLERLGLTKYAFSKIIHNKQKMYLNDFIDLAYELNLLHPDTKLPFMDAYLWRASVHRYKSLISSRYWSNKLYEEAKAKVDKENGITTHPIKEYSHPNTTKAVDNKTSTDDNQIAQIYQRAYKNIINAQNLLDDSTDYDMLKPSIGRELLDLLQGIKDELAKNRSQFDETSYLEYLHLKKNAELIENQYVFNLTDISPE